MKKKNIIKELGLQKEFNNWLKDVRSKPYVGDKVRVMKMSNKDRNYWNLPDLEGEEAFIIREDENAFGINVNEGFLWWVPKEYVRKIK